MTGQPAGFGYVATVHEKPRRLVPRWPVTLKIGSISRTEYFETKQDAEAWAGEWDLRGFVTTTEDP